MREARERAGLSQNRLALLSEVQQSTINKIEQGIRPASREVMEAISPHLGATVELMQAWLDLDRLGPVRARALCRLLGEEH